ncbi:dixin isoform X2 [Esox lucius]|uniref:dixin isoform X2 n=2 Tax=Esox lucius TaxID=8010 RepID=UPI0010BD6BEE|nr:dixin isoform X2 [Esox lucius]
MIASLSKSSLLDDVLQEGFNEQQLSAYVSWVNNQLRKRPGLKPVSDLRLDLQDGVVLTHLVEIVAGEVLEGVYDAPKDREESRQNVERVLSFICSKQIRMPQTSAQDIVEGNLKSVMRLILALAAHFKPSANQRAVPGSRWGVARAANHRTLSTVAMAQNAAAALAAARHDAERPVRHTPLRSGWGVCVDEDGGVCVRALVQQYERRPPDATDTTSSSSPRAPPTSQSDDRELKDNQQESSSKTHTSEDAWAISMTGSLEREMQETRRMVSALQALLLHGSLPEDEQEEFSLTLGEDNAQQQLVVIRSCLDQSMEETQELKRELLRCKQELRNLQGVKDAQQQRLCVQEECVLQLKQELLRAGMNQDQLTSISAELQRKLEDRNRMLNECKKELGQKDKLLQQQKHKLEENQQQKAVLQRELESKDNILKEMMNHHGDQSRPHLTGHTQQPPGLSSLSGAEELQLVRSALRSLRGVFRDQDPQQHTLDTLEQGIASLTDRLTHTHQERSKSSGHCRTTHTQHQSWPPSKVAPSSSSLSSSGSTKVLYFTDHSHTPCMIHISKRLGEVTLRDIKTALDRDDHYRFHFKALDPEFGTVKEEVFEDEAVVPGWEGKIVAWVEEDHEEDRT